MPKTFQLMIKNILHSYTRTIRFSLLQTSHISFGFGIYTSA